MKKAKLETITLKVDESLAKALRGIENRSAFIRSAILAALGGKCPLCMGSGRLSPDQIKHWETFEKSHSVEECPKCHEMHITCSRGGSKG